MSRRLVWAVAGIALLGTAGAAGAVIVASSGGEEEILLQEPTQSPADCPHGAPDYPDPLVPPSPPECLDLDEPSSDPPTECIDANGDGICTGYAPDYLIDPAGLQFSFPPPPTLPYTCIYMVVDAQLVCEPMNGNTFPDGCSPIMWEDRAACLPVDAQLSSVISDGYIEGAWLPACRGGHYIRRGHSVINWGLDAVCDYYVAPEDEADFQGLKELFLPGGATPPPAPFQYSCRYIVIDGELLCLPMDNPAVRACTPAEYQGRSGCAPPGTQFSGETADYFDPVRGETVYKSYSVIARGNTRIKYGPLDEGLVEYFIAPEDAVDFAALDAVFHPN